MEFSRKDNTYSWETVKNAWAKVERQGKDRIFSKFSQSAPFIKVTMRKMALSRNNAIRFNGKHCIIIDVIPHDNRLYMTISACILEPTLCNVTESKTRIDKTYNRPILESNGQFSFQAHITEKYSKFDEGIPNDNITILYILVTPKEVYLDSGEIVCINNEKYCVQASHLLDEYLNEFEIFKKEDV